jgi:hypothetical protein
VTHKLEFQEKDKSSVWIKLTVQTLHGEGGGGGTLVYICGGVEEVAHNMMSEGTPQFSFRQTG